MKPMTMPMTTFAPMMDKMILPRHRLGQENGQHLVGGGEEHGEQRPQRDHATRVQCGRHGREAALGHHAQKCADDGPGRAGVADGLLGLAAGLVLEPLHGQVGDEQKRDEVQGVGQRMLQHVPGYVRDGFHGPKTLSASAAASTESLPSSTMSGPSTF